LSSSIWGKEALMLLSFFVWFLKSAEIERPWCELLYRSMSLRIA